MSAKSDDKVGKDDEVVVDANKLPWEKSPDHRHIYINNVGVATSTHDVQLRLGQLSTATGNRPVNFDVGTLFMSPSQAKAMAILLLTKVSEYETKHRITLPLPPHIAKLVEAAPQGSSETVPPKR